MKEYIQFLAKTDKQDVALTIGSAPKDSKFFGDLRIGDYVFDLVYSSEKDGSSFVAVYSNLSDQGINIKELVGEISSEIAEYIPDSLEINLKYILLGLIKSKDAGSRILFGLDIGTGINLSNLPLVGKEFPPDQKVGVENLQMLVASEGLNKNDVETLNEALDLNKDISEGVARLPEPGDEGYKTLVLSASMMFGSSTETLTWQVGGGQAISRFLKRAADEASEKVKWFKLQKNFGPVHFERVGVQYEDQTIWFMLDAALSVAGLTLSMDGLSFGSSLTKFDPKFNLHGLGIDYKNDPVEIGGAFLRTQETADDGTIYDAYNGTAIVKTGTFALSAIGSYAKLNGHHSLFVYAVLDYPLGGPAFFFVTGLSAGFGYNRALRIPDVAKVAEFPLVAEAVSGASKIVDLREELGKLKEYIPPTIGEYFLAVGIKFTSFKMVDSLALLTVSFGERFEIDVLGLSTLVMPAAAKDITPLAEVQMAIKASFIPDQGFLGVSGQLTSASYILSKSCHLTGGFAFYCWFSGEHAGDFVLTLGGYHPSFRPPDHYPGVSRLGLNWNVDTNLAIKGELYCALTPHSLMAGGCLEATWQSDDITAWFKASADFLIAWKPYHYDAAMSVDVGVSYTYHLIGTHHITVNVGADLHIWGPEFSGNAHIHLSVISFDVSFGSSSSSSPQPIEWGTFKESFLPGDDAVCGISIRDGLVREAVTEEEESIWVVNPKDFSLVTNSVIPSKEAFRGEDNEAIDIAGNANANFGIGSMGVKSGDLCSKHTIEISKYGLLFSVDASGYQSGLDNATVSADLREKFEDENITLSEDATVSIQEKGSRWLITDNHEKYLVRKEEDKLNIYHEEHVEDDFEYTPILKNVPSGLWGESMAPELNGNRFISNALSGFEIRPGKQPEPSETKAIDYGALQYHTDPINDAYVWENFITFELESSCECKRREEIRERIVSCCTKKARNNLLKALDLCPGEVDLDGSIADDFLIAPQIVVEERNASQHQR